MDRRAFLGTVTLFAVPRAAGAQPAGKVHHVGVLSVGGNVTTWRVGYRPFIEAMRDLDYVEGRNLAFRPAFADGKPERLPALVAELLRANVDVIVASANREAAAARRAASSLPIVAWLLSDPVTEGLVASLARPGGNITGLTNLVPGLSQKYVEVLREAVPSASRFCSHRQPGQSDRGDPAGARSGRKSAGRGGVHRPMCPAPTTSTASSPGPNGTERPASSPPRRHDVSAPADPRAGRLEAQAAGNLLVRAYVEAGGLMTYSANIDDLRRRVAIHVDKVLRALNQEISDRAAHRSSWSSTSRRPRPSA